MAHIATYRNVVSPVALIKWFLNFVAGIVFALLGLRFVFELLGANTGSGLVNWIYETSYPLVRPFQGIFSIPNIEGNSVFDVTALLAILIYGILLYLIQYALEGITRNRTDRVEVHDSHHEEM